MFHVEQRRTKLRISFSSRNSRHLKIGIRCPPCADNRLTGARLDLVERCKRGRPGGASSCRADPEGLESSPAGPFTFRPRADQVRLAVRSCRLQSLHRRAGTPPRGLDGMPDLLDVRVIAAQIVVTYLAQFN